MPVCLLVVHACVFRRTVFYRERAAGMYGCVPFFLAETVVELPWVAVKTALFCVISYFG